MARKLASAPMDAEDSASTAKFEYDENPMTLERLRDQFGVKLAEGAFAIGGAYIHRD